MPRNAKVKERAAAVSSPKPELEAKTAERPEPAARRKRAKRPGRASECASGRPPRRTLKAGPRSRRGRVRYPDQQRQNILVTARRENLTGAQVRARFGVSTLSFYAWRKKAAKASKRGADRRRSKTSFGRSAQPDGGDFATILHREVRARIAEVLPGIIRSEIAVVLGVMASRRGRR